LWEVTGGFNRDKKGGGEMEKRNTILTQPGRETLGER